MQVRTIYIDDDDKELRKYQKKFEEDERSKNNFKVVSINPQKPNLNDLLKEIKKKKFDLILIDFDLSKPKNDLLLGTSGAGLSAVLKENYPDIPLILFTRKSVFKVDKFPPRILSSLDGFLYKTELFKENSEKLVFLNEISLGFKRLRNARSSKFSNLLKIIDAPKTDYDLLKESNPPLDAKGNWSVSEVTQWIREVILNYPGILYDSLHAATFVGISEHEFLTDQVQNLFEKAKYSGIFGKIDKCWWKSSLRKIAISKMNKKEKDLPIYMGFPTALKRAKNKDVEKSKCVYSGETPAEWVCYILGKPVKIKYSLIYKIDSRPKIMDSARVSFKAIRTSNEVNDELFDPLGQQMLSEIRKGKKAM
ncbi:MAG: hypothetical protein SWH54_10810 [Thermodesulfobacteriota bacterium]|nr:hypothetical protein [Thermodesulfobacteriota bacterium]